MLVERYLFLFVDARSKTAVDDLRVGDRINNAMKQASSFPIKATLLLASTLTVMSGATISPALPAMQAHFSEVNNVEFWVRLVLTVPALFIMIGLPIAGQIVDSFGRKSLLVISTALYGLAGASGLVLNSLFAILAGRALLGLAVAGVMVSATTLITDYYQGDARTNFLGLQAGFMGLGGVLFLSVGGFIADMSWRFPFGIYLFAWLLLPTMVFALFEPDRSASDKKGSAQASAAMPIKLLVLLYGAALVMQLAFYLVPVQMPFFLQEIAGAGATRSGLAIAFAILFSAIASIKFSAFKQRFSYIKILAISFLLMGIGYIGVGLASSYWLVMLVMIPAGVGLGLLMPNINVWISAEVPDRLKGRALGGVSTFMFLGQFLSPIVSQPVSQSVGLAGTYGLAGVALAVVGALVWLFQRQICHQVDSRVGQAA